MDRDENEITVCIERPTWFAGLEYAKWGPLLVLLKLALAFSFRGYSFASFVAEGLKSAAIVFFVLTLIVWYFWHFIRYRLTDKRIIIYSSIKNSQEKKKNKDSNKEFFAKSEIFSIRMNDSLLWQYTVYRPTSFATLRFRELPKLTDPQKRFRVHIGFAWYFVTLLNPLKSFVLRDDGEIVRRLRAMANFELSPCPFPKS